jgi:hypothetical protein
MIGAEFASCHLKLGRAREHFDGIKSELSEWRDSRPYSIIKEHNAEVGRHSMIVELRSSPFDRWSLMAADCVSNLRSVLDHLVYAFAVRDTGKAIPPDAWKLQFPICDDCAAFKREIKKGRINGLGSKAQAFIERAQPYNRGYTTIDSTRIPPILTVLREFNDLDKHRLLNVAITHITQGQINFASRRQPPSIHWLKTQIKSGTVIAFFDLNPPEPDVDYRYDISFNITVAHIPGPTGAHVSPLGTILGLMIEEVTRLVNGAVTN